METKGLSSENKETKEVPPPSYCIIRDNIIINVPYDVVKENSFHLDSDIYQLKQDGPSTLLFNNKKRLLTNESFVPLEKLDSKEIDIDKITAYLKYHGKIPEYIELRLVDNGEIGVFTKIQLNPAMYLGTITGICRPSGKIQFGHVVKNFKSENVAVMDTENIFFSNWTRFIRINEHYNCDVQSSNFSSLLFTTVTISPDAELVRPPYKQA